MPRRILTLVSLVVFVLVGVAHAASAPATGQVAPPLSPPPGEPPPPSEEPPSPAPEPETARPEFPPLPEDSGAGRRVVYSVSEQRVWLVEQDETVSASWLVSGRKGIPRPGTYAIYSRSRWSSANGGKVRMEYMMRFVRPKGRGLAIGFHAIPIDRRGRPIQSEDELGQPRSKGCVRQARGDAEHLWNWAPDGTTVRVTR
jgi:lipoprotein-anchoring transpeptidase ErfK/SrfK